MTFTVKDRVATSASGTLITPGGRRFPEAAGVIHTDFQRGFIRAETIQWDELLECGSWAKAREVGKARVEGKDYVVQDGDVMDFRFNV